MSSMWSYLVVAGLAAGASWYWRGRRDTTTTTDMAPVVQPEPHVYRRLDLVAVHCDEQHLNGPVPTGYLARRYTNRDVKELRRHGWGSTDHINMCYRHNTGDTDLRKVHVVCRYGDCGERDVLRVDRVNAEFDRLRSAGWVNAVDTDDVLCPVHSGARAPRPRW